MKKTLIGRTETESFHINKNSFRVGIISDTQLPPCKAALKKDDTYLTHLKKALTVLKNNKADMILFAGDIGDCGTRFAYRLYTDTIEEIFGREKPIIQTVMGNHDYYNMNLFTAINHVKAFTKITGKSPWTHYVVNGFHFIGASPNNCSMHSGYEITAKWLEEELKKASRESDGKPIFVLTHNQPKDTCYGTDEWGDTSLNGVLSKYPNVINFSGHSHYSILDERSVWQGDYTVMSTQSLSYTELETGKENGTIPPNAKATPMGYIMEIKADKIDVHRINFADGNRGAEQKRNRLWSFELPYKNDGKYAFESRKKQNTPPCITDKNASVTVQQGKVQITFQAGEDDDFVHSYRVSIDEREEKLFFSDFYNGIDAMKPQVTIELPYDGKQHTYKIYAVDSWGEQSPDCINITA